MMLQEQDGQVTAYRERVAKEYPVGSPPQLLAQEVAGLPPNQLLCEQQRIPRVLRKGATDPIATVRDRTSSGADVQIRRRRDREAQYLRLGARVLSFNEDPKFSDVLDALMILDLAMADRRLLRRYMGIEGMAGRRCSFSSSHTSYARDCKQGDIRRYHG